MPFVGNLRSALLLNLISVRQAYHRLFIIKGNGGKHAHVLTQCDNIKPLRQLWTVHSKVSNHPRRPGSAGLHLSCTYYFPTPPASGIVSISLAKVASSRTLLQADAGGVCSKPAGSVPHLTGQQVRRKSRRKQSSVRNDSDSDSEDDDVLEADDFDAPAKFKVMKIHTASMRTDAIISSSLDVSRNRLEEVFYGSGLLLNGGKMLKKSIKMEEGDYVDLVVDKRDDQLKVKRVKVMKIYSRKTNTDKLSVKVRVWKAPFLIDNPDNGRRAS